MEVTAANYGTNYYNPRHTTWEYDRQYDGDLHFSMCEPSRGIPINRTLQMRPVRRTTVSDYV